MRTTLLLASRFASETAGSLYRDDQKQYSEKLAERLSGLSNDLHQQAVAYTRYCSTQRGKLLVIVVDNRDKPALDTALKDLVFRLEPPMFHHVLVSRVQIAL
ncbi:MAG: hypothetical protein WBS19_07380 [Candidatus Korobacteraceae bacterium]